MQFHKQTILHDPDNGQYGDCFRTALACLLDLEPQDVPHFMDGVGDDQEAIDAMWDRIEEWLSLRGLARFRLAHQSMDEAMGVMQYLNPGVYYLLIGQSPRGTTHNVIALGEQIVHDPHPDGGGLVGPCEEDGLYWMETVVPSQITTAFDLPGEEDDKEALHG